MKPVTSEIMKTIIACDVTGLRGGLDRYGSRASRPAPCRNLVREVLRRACVPPPTAR